MGKHPDVTVILKTGAIGDMLMMSPAVRAIRAALPDTRIVLVTGRGMMQVVWNNPDYDDFIAVDERAVFRGSVIEKSLEMLKLVRTVRALHPARIFVMHGDARWNFIARMTGAPRRYGFIRDGRSRFLTDAAPETGHELDRYLGIAKLLDGVQEPSRKMVVAASDDEKREARSMLARIGGERPVVAIAPGGAENAKMASPLRRWPLERYRSVAQRLVEKAGVAVALVGGPGDAEAHRFVAGGSPHVYDTIGLNVPATVEMLKSCTVMLTHDSGPLHMASAAGIPVAGLYGPTNPAHTGPTSPRSVVVFRGGHLPCCPCHKNGSYANCAGNECMAAIGVDDAVDAVVSILNETES